MKITEIKYESFTGKCIESTTPSRPVGRELFFAPGMHVNFFEFLKTGQWYLLEEVNESINPDGLSCMKCNLFYSCVASNQPNGTYLCYNCRS